MCYDDCAHCIQLNTHKYSSTSHFSSRSWGQQLHLWYEHRLQKINSVLGPLLGQLGYWYALLCYDKFCIGSFSRYLLKWSITRYFLFGVEFNFTSKVATHGLAYMPWSFFLSLIPENGYMATLVKFNPEFKTSTFFPFSSGKRSSEYKLLSYQLYNIYMFWPEKWKDLSPPGMKKHESVMLLNTSNIDHNCYFMLSFLRRKLYEKWKYIDD